MGGLAFFAVRGSRLRLWLAAMAAAAAASVLLLWLAMAAASPLCCAFGPARPSTAAAYSRSAETTLRIEGYQRDFAKAWAEEAQWRRKAEGGAAERPQVAPLTEGPSSPLLPAAAHAARRGRGPVDGGASSKERRPPFAVAALLTLTADMCRAAWLQFRSLHRWHAGQVDYLVAYARGDEAEDWRALTTDPFCRLLYSQSVSFHASSPPAPSAAPVGRVRFLPVEPAVLPSWISPRFARWAYCAHKLPLLLRTEYAKLLYLDVDVVVAGPLAAFFQLPFHVAAGLDTAQSCGVASASKLNAGVLLLTPSAHLHSAFHVGLHSRDFSCISGAFEEVEQELLNCLCGYGQGGRPALPLRPDLQCGMLPYYANTVPSYHQCPDYSADEVLLVHFADTPKPWQPTTAPTAAHCRALAVNATWDREDGWFEAEERRPCFTAEAAFDTFYHCLEGGEADAQRLTINRDCRLLSVDQTRERIQAAPDG